MKLYNSIGPNPRIVRMFLAEKGLEIPRVEIDIMKGENRQSAHLARNPAGQAPVLELDDGTAICEVSAICEYLEEVHPAPALIGATPVERAQTRMWARRCDLNINEPMASGFRYAEGLPMFRDRIPCEPDAAPGLKRVAQNRMAWLSAMKQPDDKWLCGARFTYADILLFAFLDFGRQVGQQINPDALWMKDWFARVADRPSAKA